MNREEFLKQLFNIIFVIAPWAIVGGVAFFMYFFYDEELYKQIMMFIIPVGFYSIAMLLVVWFHSRKRKKLKAGGSETGKSIYIDQWDLMKHDLITFVVPLIMILVTKFYKDEIDGFDIILSIIAFIGLYISKAIYKIKMKYN